MCTTPAPTAGAAPGVSPSSSETLQQSQGGTVGEGLNGLFRFLIYLQFICGLAVSRIYLPGHSILKVCFFFFPYLSWDCCNIDLATA